MYGACIDYPAHLIKPFGNLLDLFHPSGAKCTKSSREGDHKTKQMKAKKKKDVLSQLAAVNT